MRRYRPLPAVVFAIVVSALVGGFFGRSALATDDKIPEHYKAFTAALSAIETNYVDKVESDNLVTSAVRGHARHARSALQLFHAARVRADARAAGRALLRHRRLDSGRSTATSRRSWSSKDRRPTRRASASGDVISKIVDEKTRRAGPWSRRCTRCAARRARPCRSSIRRRGYEELIRFELTRDEVYIPTVPAYFMIDATTGYIRMQDFGENTDRDVKHALHDLAAKGMRRLLFDVRGNPGGPLDQAIKVANEFLPRGKMIVYTRGRIPNSDQDYRATEDSEFTDMPIVVLANRNSASAAEIVTGALQDHDRAYIVGETTFGKALVQSVYRISGNAGLALTTAHYYTPSGRLIQRPWDASFDEYLSYSLRDQDVAQTAQPGGSEAHRRRPSGVQRRRRRAGQARRRPARRVQSRPLRPHALRARRRSRTTRRNSRRKATRASRGTSTGRRTVKPDFVVDDAMVADFREQLEDGPNQDRRRRVQEGHRLHSRDDPFPHRRSRVRHRRRAAAPHLPSIRRRRRR